MKKIIILLLSFMLISCKGMQIQTNLTSSFLPFSQAPWIEIIEPLKIAPSNARAYMQNGKQINPSKLDLYQTNCEIEVNNVLETEQTVFPGDYKITKISTREGPVVLLKHSRIQYAMGGGKGSIDIKRTWRFRLQSKLHPEVLFMHCRGPQDSELLAELPTLDEINHAVGHLINVHLIP